MYNNFFSIWTLPMFAVKWKTFIFRRLFSINIEVQILTLLAHCCFASALNKTFSIFINYLKIVYTSHLMWCVNKIIYFLITLNGILKYICDKLYYWILQISITISSLLLPFSDETVGINELMLVCNQILNVNVACTSYF